MFDSTGNTASVDDIANLKPGGMRIDSTFGSWITLDNNLEVTGDVKIESGLILGTSKLIASNAASTFEFKGGRIDAGVDVGSAGVAPTLKFNGGLVQIGGAFTTYANATWTGSGDIWLDSTFQNRGTFDIQVDRTILSTTGQISNYGTFKKSAGVGITTIDVPAFTNAAGGSLQALSGTLFLKGLVSQTAAETVLNGGTLKSDNLFTINSGTLKGFGTFVGSVKNIGGSVIPGLGTAGGGGPAGLLTIQGDYEQQAAGTFVVNIDGAGNVGRLVVTGAGGAGGNVDLAGTIRVNRPLGFTPALGTEFTVLNYDTAVGSFTTSAIPNNSWSGGLKFVVAEDIALNYFYLQVV